MVSTLLGLSSTNGQRQGRRSEVEDDAVQPTRGVGLIEVRPDMSRRAVSWLNAGDWFSIAAPPSLDRRNTAGGVASDVSRFVASGGPPPIGADGTHGQCDSSVRPASAGRTIPT